MTSQIGKLVVGVVTLFSVGVGAPTGAIAFLQAQTQGQAPQGQAPREESMLKVDVVLTRQRVQAPAKGSANLEAAAKDPVSRLPYTLFAQLPPPPGTGRSTSLRVGVDIPGEPLTTTSKEGVTTTRREGRHVGTQIDTNAALLSDGRIRLYISIQDSSVVPADRAKELVSPVIRSFTTQNHLVLRAGQPMTFTVGSDPISGETLSAEVTVSAVK